MALVTQTAQICLVIATLLYRGRGIVGHLIEALGFHAELLLVVASVCASPNGRSRRGSEEVPDCGNRTIVQVRCVRPNAIEWRGDVAVYGEIERRFAVRAHPTLVEMLHEFDREIARPDRIGADLTKVDHSLGVASSRTIGPVALGTVREKYDCSVARQRLINRIGIFR